MPLHPLRRRGFLKTATATLLGASAAPGMAQSYPDKPVVLINGYTAGGNTDIFLRESAAIAARYLPNANFVVENRPGANAAIAAQYMVRSKPDGYTVMQFTTAMMRAPYIQDTPYRPMEDFTYIIAMADIMLGIAVRADAPWKSMADLIAAAKAQPGKLTYATPGLGTAGHLIAESISAQAGINLNHVLFKGAPEYTNALGGGHIDIVIDTPTWASLLDSNRARLLAVLGTERLKRWPDVPTLAEQGIDFGMTAPFGLIGPKGMDPVAVKALHDAFKRSMDDPAYDRLLERLQFKRFYRGMGEFDSWAKESYALHGALLKKMGLATRNP